MRGRRRERRGRARRGRWRSAGRRRGGRGGGGGGAAGGAGAGGESAVSLARVAACPLGSFTPDADHSACLVGRYAGTTPQGEACSFEIRADGSLAVATPELSFDHRPGPTSTRTFQHLEREGVHQLRLLFSDHPTTDPNVVFKAIGSFGAEDGVAPSTLGVDATRRVQGAATQGLCTVPIR